MPRLVAPLVLPCHGISSGGVRADDVAGELAARGLAEVVGDIEAVVAAAREGREVLALDGCAASCQARLLDAHGVGTLKALNLEVKRGGDVDLAASSSIEELEEAAAPIKRSRRATRLLGSEFSNRSSHSIDDYLLALDMLMSPVVECGALVDAPTFAVQVGQLLGVSRPAVGEMLARLEEAGYIHRGAHKDVLFTPQGRLVADESVRKQRVLERFAVETLGYGVEECYQQARGMAGGFDSVAADRLWVSLGRPERCPHGWPVSAERSRDEARDLVALSAAPPGTASVERLDESSGDRIRALLEAGIVPGSRIQDVSVNEPAQMVTFAVANDRDGSKSGSISLALSNAVLVRAA